MLTPALAITSTANSATAVPGGTVRYTVTITNAGQTPYTGTTVADSLAGVLDDASYNRDASATDRDGLVREPGADLDREPEPG